MPQFNTTDAYGMATKLITAALESKAITLRGPVGGSEPAQLGEIDAKYLNALINAVAKNFQS